MTAKRINPKWLLAAEVLDTSGNRFGTVAAINPHDRDTIVVLRAGIEHTFSVAILDRMGRLQKPHASCPKYIRS